MGQHREDDSRHGWISGLDGGSGMDTRWSAFPLSEQVDARPELSNACD